MEILELALNEVIEQGLNNSMSYEEYTQLMQEMVENESTSGAVKTEELVEFTKLNQKRMRRWDKTLTVSSNHKNIIEEYKHETTWLVIAETWCGDAAHVVPVINKVASLNEKIKVRVVLRDENEALMDNFLTNGGRAIPKLIMLNKDIEVTGEFGSRPSVATKLVEDYKAANGKLTPEFKADLQVWYNKDKGQSTVDDLVQLLKD